MSLIERTEKAKGSSLHPFAQKFLECILASGGIDKVINAKRAAQTEYLISEIEKGIKLFRENISRGRENYGFALKDLELARNALANIYAGGTHPGNILSIYPV